jgi:hypothetical protein
MKNKGILSLALLLLLYSSCFYVNASLITYNGYSYDDSSNIVKSDSLDWLRLDLTTNESIYSFLNNELIYSTSEWRLATSYEVEGLFNDLFSSINWNLTSYPSDLEIYKRYSFQGNNSPTRKFIELFGYTSLNDLFDDQLQANSIFYDPYISRIGYINVHDYYKYGQFGAAVNESVKYAFFDPFTSSFNINSKSPSFSLMLVKVNEVPEPSSLYLLVPLLLTLIRSKKKLRK